MEIKTKFKIGDRIIFIEDGKMVFDNIAGMTVYVYEDGTQRVFYTFKETEKYKWESEICRAAK